MDMYGCPKRDGGNAPICPLDPDSKSRILNVAENTSEGEQLKCPCCGYPLPFQSLQWQNELPILVARYAGELGITPELAGLTLIELYGLYLHLLEYGCKS